MPKTNEKFIQELDNILGSHSTLALTSTDEIFLKVAEIKSSTDITHQLFQESVIKANDIIHEM